MRPMPNDGSMTAGVYSSTGGDPACGMQGMATRTATIRLRSETRPATRARHPPSRIFLVVLTLTCAESSDRLSAPIVTLTLLQEGSGTCGTTPRA